jgi:hypothetical protein
MPWQTEGKYISDVVKYEIPEYSRDSGVIAGASSSETTLDIGTVLGVKASTGSFMPLNTSATTGEQVAAAVLLQKVTVTSTATAKAVILTRHATIAPSALVFPSGISAADTKAAIAELAAVGIIAREEA